MRGILDLERERKLVESAQEKLQKYDEEGYGKVIFNTLKFWDQKSMGITNPSYATL